MIKTQDYISKNKEKQLQGLITLLKIKSISADPQFKADVAKCAEQIKNELVAKIM